MVVETLQHMFQQGWTIAQKESALPLGAMRTATEQINEQVNNATLRTIYIKALAYGIFSYWNEMLKDNRDVSIIIPASNEESTMKPVLEELTRFKPGEIIVVINGSSDTTLSIAKQYACKIIEFDERIGHDVGRSVGAASAAGEILLFLDADMSIQAEELVPFVLTIRGGADVALNNIDPLRDSAYWDSVSILKYFLNAITGNSHMGTGSLTAVPHAIHRRVLNQELIRDLSVPPKAYVELIEAGARIVFANCVDVITNNRIRPVHSTFGRNLMEDLIMGDHLEAIACQQQAWKELD